MASQQLLVVRHLALAGEDVLGLEVVQRHAVLEEASSAGTRTSGCPGSTGSTSGPRPCAGCRNRCRGPCRGCWCTCGACSCASGATGRTGRRCPTRTSSRKSVIAIGTKDGEIMKIVPNHLNVHDLLLGKRNTPLFSMNLSKSGEKIAASNAFSPDKNSLYFITGNQLVNFPIGSCSIYTDCSSCLMKKDPLNCGWCNLGKGDSYCAHSTECSGRLDMNVCPPEIIDFTPKSGRTSGGTELSTSGDNFADRDNDEPTRLEVMVGKI